MVKNKLAPTGLASRETMLEYKTSRTTSPHLYAQ